MKAKIINWKNKTITFPFNKARFTVLGIVSNMMVIIPPNSIFFTYFISTGFEKDQKRCLSFFVWYMDKNRPLPPDPRLDPYRGKDYRRREKAGFPPPLYPSTIPTPETYIPIKW
ncbi:MAG: hypothetical protein LUE98_16920 [Tannerellaceae bacterium]|nr:hypothetical protein [Tannerellaceae bacterium]